MKKSEEDPSILHPFTYILSFQVKNSIFFVSDSPFPSSVLFIPSSPFPFALPIIINFHFFPKEQ